MRATLLLSLFLLAGGFAQEAHAGGGVRIVKTNSSKTNGSSHQPFFQPSRFLKKEKGKEKEKEKTVESVRTKFFAPKGFFKTPSSNFFHPTNPFFKVAPKKTSK